MDIFEAIFERRSTRSFDKTKKIPEEVVGKILDAARYAPPTPLGDYPYRIIKVKDEGTKKLAADCAEEITRVIFGGSFETFREHLWYMPDDVALRVAEYTTTGTLWRYPEDCDVLFVPVMAKSDWGCGLGGVVRTPEQVAPYLGFAAENMWLVGHAYGVSCGYNAVPMVDARRREVAQVELGVPHTWDPTGDFSFGYANTGRAAGPSRGSLEGLAFTEYWGNNLQKAAFRGDYAAFGFPKMDVFDCIKNLNLVGGFKSGKVDPLIVETMLNAASWAPNPENFKPWRFVVVRDAGSKDYLHRLVNERKHTPFYFNDAEWQYARTWYLDDEKRLALAEQRFKSGIAPWLNEADTLIIVLSSNGWSDSAQLANAIAFRNPPRHIATGCGIQNMMLAATGFGLGVNFEPTPGADHRSKEQVQDFFGIPPSWDILGILGVGEPGAKLERGPLPNVGALVYDEQWGNPHQGPIYTI